MNLTYFSVIYTVIFFLTTISVIYGIVADFYLMATYLTSQPTLAFYIFFGFLLNLIAWIFGLIGISRFSAGVAAGSKFQSETVWFVLTFLFVLVGSILYLVAASQEKEQNIDYLVYNFTTSAGVFGIVAAALVGLYILMRRSSTTFSKH